MSYLALARKYRPGSFEGIAGQDHVTRTLARAIARDRIHHAYLFCGARGVGKTTAARALAKALNCADGPTATPCGVCVSCKAVEVGNSPDLIEIDGASNNGVDNIRELRDTVRYPPQGRFKIYLVDEVHMLSTAAFNALLKTLEEPPAHVVFLFATTEPQKIPDTILSRVLRFDFKRIPVDVVTARLRAIVEAEGADASDEALRLLARAGEGSMRDAQSLLDKVLSSADGPVDAAFVAETLGMVDRELVLGALEALVAGDIGALLDVIATVHDFGVDLGQLAAELLEAVRHATLLALGEAGARHVDVPEAERARIVEIVADADPDRLSRLFHALLDVQDRLARADQPRLVLEMSLARLATIRPTVPVATLVDRLERLEGTLRRGGAGGSRAGSIQPQGGPRRARVPTGPSTRARRRGGTHGGTRRVPDDASDDERWAAFRSHLEALAVLPALDGLPRRVPGALILTVPGGQRRAEAVRAAAREDVLAAVATCYGEGTTLQIETSLASREHGLDPALEATVLSDPAVKRLMQVLGAQLVSLEPDVPPSAPGGSSHDPEVP